MPPSPLPLSEEVFPSWSPLPPPSVPSSCSACSARVTPFPFPFWPPLGRYGRAYVSRWEKTLSSPLSLTFLLTILPHFHSILPGRHISSSSSSSSNSNSKPRQKRWRPDGHGQLFRTGKGKNRKRKEKTRTTRRKTKKGSRRECSTSSLPPSLPPFPSSPLPCRSSFASPHSASPMAGAWVWWWTAAPLASRSPGKRSSRSLTDGG